MIAIETRERGDEMTEQERRTWSGEQERDEERFWAGTTCSECDTQGEWDTATDGTHTCRNCGQCYEDAE